MSQTTSLDGSGHRDNAAILRRPQAASVVSDGILCAVAMVGGFLTVPGIAGVRGAWVLDRAARRGKEMRQPDLGKPHR